MDEIRIKQLINKGESINLEFKEATHTLPKSFFETVCAFLNQQGGVILLGVTDSQEIVGVLEHSVEKLCKDISNVSNNANKLDPVFLLQPTVIEVENKKIIYVIVPSSSQVHKTNNNYYDRSSDGDFIVKSHSKISELYGRKNTMFSENTIYPYLAEEHFDEDTVNKVYQLIRTYRPTHPWLEFTGLDFYKKAGLYRYDFNSGKSGFTLSALLLLGNEEAITSILPHYKIEVLHYLYDNEQYNDRETIECNIITAYEMVMKFIAKHLPDKFYLEGDQRVSLRDNLFREIVANFLIHREYINPRVSRVEIRHDVVIFKNANKPHLYGSINVDSYESYPKNPHLAKFFVQIGRAEELGMGIKKIFKFCNLYSEQNPQIKDEDLFEVYIPITTPSGLEDTITTGLEDTTTKYLKETTPKYLTSTTPKNTTPSSLEGNTTTDLEDTTTKYFKEATPKYLTSTTPKSTTPSGLEGTTTTDLEDTTTKYFKETTPKYLKSTTPKNTTPSGLEGTTTTDLEDTTTKYFKETTPKYLTSTTPSGLEGSTATGLEETTPKYLKSTTPRNEIRNTIIALLSEDPYLSASKIGEKLQITRDGVIYHLKILKNNKQIKFEGKPQTGTWKILKK